MEDQSRFTGGEVMGGNGCGNGLSIIIPSRNAANLFPCLRSIEACEPTTKVIVVDDGVDWPDEFELSSGMELDCIPGVKEFIFARNINLGIQAAGLDDVIVLNDDALLLTPNGFTRLHKMSIHNLQFGIISAACNNVGNMNMHWQRGPANILKDGTVCPALREDQRMVCFVSVLIPRSTINKVGLLDHRFINYGLDDDDYSYRVRRAGLKIGIWDGCVVDHSKLTSTFRTPSPTNSSPGDFKPNLALYIRKWGVDNWGKGRSQSSFAGLFPAGEWECEHCYGLGISKYGIDYKLPCDVCSGRGVLGWK